jgi:hypothetical protein
LLAHEQNPTAWLRRHRSPSVEKRATAMDIPTRQITSIRSIHILIRFISGS